MNVTRIVQRNIVSVPQTTGAAGTRFRTWNQFQDGTAGQFASRAEAARAWSVYKEANGIVTGTVRSQAASRQIGKGVRNRSRHLIRKHDRGIRERDRRIRDVNTALEHETDAFENAKCAAR